MNIGELNRRNLCVNLLCWSVTALSIFGSTGHIAESYWLLASVIGLGGGWSMSRILLLLGHDDPDADLATAVPEIELGMAKVILALPIILAAYAIYFMAVEHVPVARVEWVMPVFALQIGREGERLWRSWHNR